METITRMGLLPKRDTATTAMDAQKRLFIAKWATVQKAIRYRCRSYQPADVDDLLGTAGLTLWRQVHHGVENISADVIVMSAVSQWASAQRRNRPADGASLTTIFDEPEARGEPFITIDRVKLGLTDAALDHAGLCELWTNGISMSETARRLGVSRQRVFQRAAELGGVRFPGTWGTRATWKFPKDTGLPAVALDEAVGPGDSSTEQCATYPKIAYA